MMAAAAVAMRQVSGDDHAVRGNRCDRCGGAVIRRSGLRRGAGAVAALYAGHAANLERDLGSHHLHDVVQLDLGAVPDHLRRSRRERVIDRGANDRDGRGRARLDRLVLSARLHHGAAHLPEHLLAKVAFALTPSCPRIAVRRTASVCSPMSRAFTTLVTFLIADEDLRKQTWIAGTSPTMTRDVARVSSDRRSIG